MRRSYLLVALLLSTSFPASATADLVVVVGPRSSVTTLDRTDIVNIYMGRYRKFPDGQPAHPLDLSADSPERAGFYRGLLGKRLDEINAYWARLVFSGRTTPPKELNNREALQSQLESDPQAIGYVERAHVTKGMHVLMAVPE
jgi:hypothetical protein